MVRQHYYAFEPVNTSNMSKQQLESKKSLRELLSVQTQGRRSEKNSGEGLKRSEGETLIQVEGGVLLGGESSQKL